MQEILYNIKVGYTYFCKALLCILKFTIVALPFAVLWNWTPIPHIDVDFVFREWFEKVERWAVFNTDTQTYLYLLDLRKLVLDLVTILTAPTGIFICTEVLLMLLVALVYVVTPTIRKQDSEHDFGQFKVLLFFLFCVFVIFAAPCVLSIAILLIYYCVFSEYAPQVWHVIILIPAVVGAIGAVLWVCAASVGFAVGWGQSDESVALPIKSGREPKPKAQKRSIDLKAHANKLTQCPFDVRYTNKKNGSFVCRDYGTNCEFWVVPVNSHYTAWRVSVDDATCNRIDKKEVTEMKRRLQEWVNNNCQTT